MIFTIEEINNYLKGQVDLKTAIANLSEQAIINLNQYTKSACFEKNEENLKKYEIQIGIAKLIEEQLLLRKESNGEKGKRWVVLSPKWMISSPTERDTEYEIGYWVNYGDNNTYGWFTVEQIIKWLTTPDLQLHTLGGTKER